MAASDGSSLSDSHGDDANDQNHVRHKAKSGEGETEPCQLGSRLVAEGNEAEDDAYQSEEDTLRATCQGIDDPDLTAASPDRSPAPRGTPDTHR